jgi:inorganic triphosphatase YgiF
MSTEVELKFALDPKRARDLGRQVRGLAAGEPSTGALQSIYFDTPEAHLRNLQLTLRLRRVGRRWWQGIKAGDATSAGLHVRLESEHPVSRGELELDSVEDARLRKKLRKWRAADCLLPRFETVIRRTTWQLHTADGARVECALDRGQIRTADGRRAFRLCEVEPELKEGLADCFVRTRTRAWRIIAIDVDPRSKPNVVTLVAARDAVHTRQGAATSTDADMTAAEVAARPWKAHLPICAELACG